MNIPGITTIITSKGPALHDPSLEDACPECEGTGFVIGTETQESRGRLCECMKEVGSYE